MTVYHHVSTLSPIEKVEWQKHFSVINEIAMKEYNKGKLDVLVAVYLTVRNRDETSLFTAVPISKEILLGN